MVFSEATPLRKPFRRGVAQSGSASALGAEGRGFESLRPDHRINNLKGFTDSSNWHCSGYCSGWLSFLHFQPLPPLVYCVLLGSSFGTWSREKTFMTASSLG